MSAIQNFSKAVAFLTLHGLDYIPCEIEAESGNHLTVKIYNPRKLSPEEFRKLKKIFGPLKATGSADWRGLEGERKLDDNFTIYLRISRAFICEKVDPKELTEQKWEELRQKVANGTIEISDCNPIEAEREGEIPF